MITTPPCNPSPLPPPTTPSPPGLTTNSLYKQTVITLGLCRWEDTAPWASHTHRTQDSKTQRTVDKGTVCDWLCEYMSGVPVYQCTSVPVYIQLSQEIEVGRECSTQHTVDRSHTVTHTWIDIYMGWYIHGYVASICIYTCDVWLTVQYVTDWLRPRYISVSYLCSCVLIYVCTRYQPVYIYGIYVFTSHMILSNYSLGI